MNDKGLPRIQSIDDTWLVGDDDEVEPVYATQSDRADLEELIRLMQQNSWGLRWARLTLAVRQGWRQWLAVTAAVLVLMALMFASSAYGAARML